MNANQRTLFQSWGRRDQSKTSARPAAPDEEEDDDDVMLVAVYEAERSLQAAPEPGFDPSAGRVWIYPVNYPLREYQLRISEAALLRNTLVCLPTGLGKTFIASVLMYNFYRWFPAGKIVFMAPTKPLVAQQIQACHGVMGIPQEHMAELTGSTAAQQRRELWRSKRVFFLTPQVMVNDLSRNSCPAAHVRCVVIDEAHKATGNHAYCQVIRELSNQTKQFRVLALSATPGGDVKAVQQVISNLLISHIELRSEDSPDVQTHVHQRSLEKIVVPPGETLAQYQTRYLQVLEKFTSRLTQMRLLNQRDLRSLTKYQIILSREQFRRNPPPHIQGPQQGVIEGDFSICISLYHGYELLQQMGLRSLFLFIQNIFSGPRGAHTLTLVSAGHPGEPCVYSHPKLQKLDEVVLQHFQTWAKSSPSTEVSTRVMIFSSFRESVQEIAEMLSRHQPLVRVMTFMGQASAGKGVRGFTQKEQLEVVRRFREGGFNTLVSTCVGEEGLDIGEVDLIVCFDAQKSPIRLVQRMGRTGRRRQGRIVVILAEGREERTYNQSQSNRRSINKSIMGNKHSFQMFAHSPRMLPAGVTPTLHKMHISCGQFEHRPVKGRRSSLALQINGTHLTSTFIMNLQHWQNGPLHTHSVGHSERCLHFTSIMELIDRMRQQVTHTHTHTHSLSLTHTLTHTHTLSLSLSLSLSIQLSFIGMTCTKVRREVRQFLDEEAELSEDEDVSSDEDEGDEQNHSLQGFVVNTTQCSQGLNDSEMQAFYLKSVRSPAVQNQLRMTYKPKHNMEIFSQIPEQDETYGEDSFVVHGSEDEEGESDSDEEPVQVIHEDSYVDGRKQYATRRRVQIRQIRVESGGVRSERNGKSKRSRIIRVQDSSEEEEEEEEQTGSVFKEPQRLQSSSRTTERDDRKRQRLSDQAALSEELDFLPEKPVMTAQTPIPPAADAPLRVLVDSRCISGGSEVVSRLRLRHGLQVHVCSLISSDFIVSDRMAVERQSESELASVQNRRRLQDRMQRLQAAFERVCLILERDRSKPGETVRVFQRSRCYDGTLVALVKAGVRLLVSNGPDDTAALLTELTQVERRKGQAIGVPLEVKGHRQQALQFYLTLPHMSYISALNMCHHFSSISHMINSSVEELQASAHMSRSRAEDVYRCLRYSCDSALMTNQP
uniref:Fanconi anemia group M protein n=1 Tax=Cyprinus carpio TaxID=7962 RepID=A0A8C2C319_CYPCA